MSKNRKKNSAENCDATSAQNNANQNGATNRRNPQNATNKAEENSEN
ncbi:MAG: hypothetical protein RSC43_04495 [Clostridia bacterium]